MITAPGSALLADARTDAVGYDHWFEEPWGRYAFGVESRALLHAAGPLYGSRVLDAGCGTGRFALAASTQGAWVVGIDPDPAMLDLAAARLDTRRVRGVVEHLPFADAVFDISLAVTVLEFVTDPSVAVAELARVTRPGGRILIGALNPHSPWGLTHRGRLGSGAWRTARFLSRAELRSLGAPQGATHLRSILYAPGAVPGLRYAGPALERIGALAPASGAFQVLVIDTPHADG